MYDACNVPLSDFSRYERFQYDDETTSGLFAIAELFNLQHNIKFPRIVTSPLHQRP